MALTSMTSSFSFTNTSDMSGVSITPIDLGPTTNYAKVKDEAKEVELSNKTAALSQGELLSYSCMPVKGIATKQKIANPGKVTEGIQVQVRLDEILRTQNDDGSIVIDEPIVLYFNFRAPYSGNITAAIISDCFKRLVSACVRENGTFRFDDLMRSALVPDVD